MYMNMEAGGTTIIWTPRRNHASLQGFFESRARLVLEAEGPRPEEEARWCGRLRSFSSSYPACFGTEGAIKGKGEEGTHNPTSS